MNICSKKKQTQKNNTVLFNIVTNDIILFHFVAESYGAAVSRELKGLWIDIMRTRTQNCEKQINKITALRHMNIVLINPKSKMPFTLSGPCWHFFFSLSLSVESFEPFEVRLLVDGLQFFVAVNVLSVEKRPFEFIGLRYVRRALYLIWFSWGIWMECFALELQEFKLVAYLILILVFFCSPWGDDEKKARCISVDFSYMCAQYSCRIISFVDSICNEQWAPKHTFFFSSCEWKPKRQADK